MTIDDLIERLNGLKASHGNVEVVLEEQSAKCLAYRDPKVEHVTMWGDRDTHRNYAYNGSMAMDYPESVVVIRI